jgi:hypothetical protein
VSAQELLYRYDEFSDLDFDRASFRSNLHYLGLGTAENAFIRNWVPSLALEWWRLHSPGDWGDPILDNTFLHLGIQRVWAPDLQNRFALSYGSAISLDATVPESQRDEHSLTLAWLAKWSPYVESTLYGRAALFDYRARNDVNLGAGASMDYKLTDWCHLSLQLAASFNKSDDENFDYKNFSVGGSLNLRIQF